MPLQVFSDGSCIHNGRPGARAGVGVYVKEDEKEVHRYSAPLLKSEPQTNQRAELQALFYALKYIRGVGALDAEVYTDSQYSIQCITSWCVGWKAKGWLKADKKPVLHQDILKPMVELWDLLKGTTTLHHVAAHTGKQDVISKGNAMADLLATAATEPIQTATISWA
jgi:ribonuclease HI